MQMYSVCLSRIREVVRRVRVSIDRDEFLSTRLSHLFESRPLFTRWWTLNRILASAGAAIQNGRVLLSPRLARFSRDTGLADWAAGRITVAAGNATL